MSNRFITVDGNEAAARIAYKLSEVIAIYPITPSSTMGELADLWASEEQKNLWGFVPRVIEMQSEGGAAGTVHGALATGALSSTFTASQGLLLMIPNMYKIAGELSPMVMHVAARSLATHGLSIFGDHSDVMAIRPTGFAMLCSGSVQEVGDLALVAHVASLRSRIPFVHFFDGFRTSHEIATVDEVTEQVIRQLVRDDDVRELRRRALSPDHPTIRGTAQNPDVFFQARERSNQRYEQCPAIVQQVMQQFGELSGRRYQLFDYVGAQDAERVVVMMGSGSEAAHEAVERLTQQGEKVGLIKVRLYRPFSVAHFSEVLPKTVKAIGVLDRTKEPGSTGEPLYQDIVQALVQTREGTALPTIVGGRYGLSSKEFTSAMAKAVFDELSSTRPQKQFSVGIDDDVTHLSLKVPKDFQTEKSETFRGVFIGLGSDGTVSANKNSIKIIADATGHHAQAYFVYDSKKAGAVTVSHLRFGNEPIRSSYLIEQANFVACHQWHFVERLDVLRYAAQGAVVLLNSPYDSEEVWQHLPVEFQKTVLEKKLSLWVIDAYQVAKNAAMARRINTIMQTCFFAISGVLPREQALEAIRNAVRETYGGRGAEIVARNIAAIDATLNHLQVVKIPPTTTSSFGRTPVVAQEAPDFVRTTLAPMMAGLGDSLPVSALPEDGTFPVGTTQWEKRNLALDIPVWDTKVCIQCNKCALVCPHAAIRAKVAEPQFLQNAPTSLKHISYKGKEYNSVEYLLQVAPEDCTGCGICVDVCPAKNKSETRLKAINMQPLAPLRDTERQNYAFFLNVPEAPRQTTKLTTVKGSQFLQPLFEYSGACAGCGETPYLKLVSQLYGDRLLIANATGCSSIYGGNLPTTPWSKNREGRGVAWANSLFEDNAEFGLGYRLTLNHFEHQAKDLCRRLQSQLGEQLVDRLLTAPQMSEADIYEQRLRVHDLKNRLSKIDGAAAQDLLALADYLVKKSVWIVGGDGWAYDIGYGGLDHVLASGEKVNILVLDTEVYSNTGGQMSKATPRAAVAKFAASGKAVQKKDLGMLAVSYGSVYVAQVAMGADDAQTLKAFIEAEQFPGTSLIIAYSHCIAHGIDMQTGMRQHVAAVESGHWPLYRYNPLDKDGQPMKLDSRAPKISFKDYAQREARYRILESSHPERAKALFAQAQADIEARWRQYQTIASAGSSSTHDAPPPENAGH